MAAGQGPPGGDYGPPEGGTWQQVTLGGGGVGRVLDPSPLSFKIKFIYGLVRIHRPPTYTPCAVSAHGTVCPPQSQTSLTLCSTPSPGRRSKGRRRLPAAAPRASYPKHSEDRTAPHQHTRPFTWARTQAAASPRTKPTATEFECRPGSRPPGSDSRHLRGHRGRRSM